MTDYEPEEISEDTVLPLLETRSLGRRIHAFQVCDSTSTFARRLLESATRPPHGTLVVTEYQRAGYGRNARAWRSPAGSSLLFSLILYPDSWPSDSPFRVTMAAALAVLRAFQAAGLPDCTIKWPNDILTSDGRKLSGILTEQIFLASPDSVTRQCAVILGIGINVNQVPDDFSPEIRHTAASLRMALDHPASRLQLLKQVLTELERCLDMPDPALFNAWRFHCSTLGRTVRIRLAHHTLTGQIIGFEPDGSLVLRHSTGQLEVIYSGDVEELRTEA